MNKRYKYYSNFIFYMSNTGQANQKEQPEDSSKCSYSFLDEDKDSI